MARDRVGFDAAVIEDDEWRVDRDVAAIAGLAFDRSGDLAAQQIEEVAQLRRDLPPLAFEVSASVEIAAPLATRRRAVAAIGRPGPGPAEMRPRAVWPVEAARAGQVGSSCFGKTLQ